MLHYYAGDELSTVLLNLALGKMTYECEGRDSLSGVMEALE